MQALERLFMDRTLSRLLSTPKGRSFVLAQAGDVEASDEGQIFDLLMANVDDAEIAKLVRIHRADEDRHAEMFHAAALRNCATPPERPQDFNLLTRLDHEFGGFEKRLQEGSLGVGEMYLILQVIEERALHQFAIMEPIMRKFDPESANVFRQVSADERRHLKYCRAISKRYYPATRDLEADLHRFRKLEAKCFAENQKGLIQHCVDQNLMPLDPVRRWALTAMLRHAPLNRTAEFQRVAA